MDTSCKMPPTTKKIIPTQKEIVPTSDEIIPTQKKIVQTSDEIVPTLKKIAPTSEEIIPTQKKIVQTLEEKTHPLLEIIPQIIGKGSPGGLGKFSNKIKTKKRCNMHLQIQNDPFPGRSTNLESAITNMMAEGGKTCITKMIHFKIV